MMLKKVGKNKYKVYRKTHSGTTHREKGAKNKTHRDWWLVHARGDCKKGVIHTTTISTPEELVGKKVEIYVKVIG